MTNVRLIPRLDIKNDTVVKGIHLEGLRVVGKPAELALRYYEQGADEILYMDIVASLYQRNSLHEIVEKASQNIFIPLIVGGGVRTLEDIRKLLRCGADKVAINTAAVKNPEFIKEGARAFGSQCIVGSIEAKRIGPGRWEAYTDNGRERTGLDVKEWVGRLLELGAGEILVTSVDHEGTRKGFDLELIQTLAPLISVPFIVCGGAGKVDHFPEVLREGSIDAIAFSSVLHYGMLTISDIRRSLCPDPGH